MNTRSGHWWWKPRVKTKGGVTGDSATESNGSDDAINSITSGGGLSGCGGMRTVILHLILTSSVLLNFQSTDAYSIPPQVDGSLSGSGVTSHEPVFYEPPSLLDLHSRKKREALVNGGASTDPIHFTLHAKSRDFHLVLERDGGVFHPQAQLLTDSPDGETRSSGFDPDRVFRGHLADDPGSRVEGLITSQGHWDGVITTSAGQVLHIEPATRYKPGNPEALSFAPGVLYEEEMVDWPTHPISTTSSHPHLHSHHHHHHHEPLSHPTNLSSNYSSSSRSRRAIQDPRRKTCLLYLQGDHLFHDHLGSEEAAITMMTRHVQRLNSIYGSTDFDGDGVPDGLSFMIKRLKVYSSSSAPDYKYLGDYPVIKFLERFSEGDYEAFCLAYMFTFRDFEGGTLGLAWTGDLKNAGGVCERKGHFRGGLKSLNTGIITLLNYGKVVLPAVSYVTLAHEIGHNFGSPHDPESERECVPGGKDGNFIMFARATGGDEKNNQRFSPCSIRSIRPVLAAKARHTHGCFTQPQSSICGNREVESGEECDCGWEEDCRESCCWPNRANPPPDQVPCTLKPHSACSPSQGPCCTSNCTLITQGLPCRDENGCRHAAACSGQAAPCPPSQHKPNRTLCGDGSNVCFLGECTGSICLAYGLSPCQCSPQPWDSPSKLCELCCKAPGEGEPCLSSFDPLLPDIPDRYAKPGSPCKNYTGYCDAYRSCREVDPSGPLATLRNLLLADEGLSAIAHWVDDHWWAVVSFLLLLLSMMILTAKLCGKQAKRKLRKITILHSNVDAIQVERSYWDNEAGEEHVVHPAAVRKKIPLRKKIREKKKGGSKSGGRRGRKGGGGSGANSSPTGGGGEEAATSATTLSTAPPTAKENKAPRYGTLWRKRRAERSRVGGNQKPKTEHSSSQSPGGGGTEGPCSGGGNKERVGGVVVVVEESFDLVQLHTPPQSHPPIYPNLTPFPATGGGVNSSQTPTTPNAPSQSQQQQHQSHQYEAKTAILPSNPRQPTGGGRPRGKRSSRRPSSSHGKSGGVVNNGVTNPSKPSSTRPILKGGVNKNIRDGGTNKKLSRHETQSPINSTTKPKNQSKNTGGTIHPPKTTLQIVYTPPFSVKVVHVPIPEGTSSPSSQPHPSTSADPLHPPQNEDNLNQRAGGKKDKKRINEGPSKQEKSSHSPTAAILQTPLPPIPTATTASPPPPPSSGPPPYQTTPHSSSSQTGPSSQLEGNRKPHEKGGIGIKRQPSTSCLSTASSFLSRQGGSGSGGGLGGGRKRSKEKGGELRVLIPPAQLGEDDLDTPITPGSS